MNNNKLLFAAFILLALVQLFVPASMIWSREDTLETGTEYKFRTAPVDPNDPFRGKFISLNYEDNTIVVDSAEDWERGEKIYVQFSTDDEGFAKIASVSKEAPGDSKDFIIAKVDYLIQNESHELVVDFPFDRFYMEESKAYDAEQMYRQSQQDSSKTTYALVSVKKGDAVLKDVLIGGVSIRELVKANKAKE